MFGESFAESNTPPAVIGPSVAEVVASLKDK